LVATASEDGTVKIWLVDSSLLLWSAELGRTPARSVEFSPDGQRLLVASGNAVTLWNVGYDQRDLSQVEAFAACRVGYELVQSRLQRRSIDYETCRD